MSSWIFSLPLPSQLGHWVFALNIDLFDRPLLLHDGLVHSQDRDISLPSREYPNAQAHLLTPLIITRVPLLHCTQVPLLHYQHDRV